MAAKKYSKGTEKKDPTMKQIDATIENVNKQFRKVKGRFV